MPAVALSRAVESSPGGDLTVGFTATISGSNPNFALARYNRDGSLDASFGTGGKLTTDSVGDADRAIALVLQRDGKLVAAGSGEGRGFDFALARYDPDGTLDASFGSSGKVLTDFAGGAAGRAQRAGAATQPQAGGRRIHRFHRVGV